MHELDPVFTYKRKRDAGMKKDARSELIVNNLRLVYFIARKYDAFYNEMDDLSSVGTIGLIKGVDSFDASKGVKFSTYIAKCINNEILMHLRTYKKTEKDISLSTPIGSDKSGTGIFLSDTLKSDNDAIFENIEIEEERAFIKEAISKLSPREQLVIKFRFGFSGEVDGESTQKEVAELLGITQPRVSKIEKQSLYKLRRYYNRFF